jgi:hypothetical protein
VKDGEKGPLVWEVKHAWLIRPDRKGLPGETLHLLVTRNVLDENEVKFFFSNAPEDATVGQMLLVAFSRWRVERCFQDQKQDIGLDAWEGRRYIGLKRHLILSSVVLVHRELEFWPIGVSELVRASCQTGRGILPRRFIAWVPIPKRVA